MSANKQWFVSFNGTEIINPKLKLYCFHYAGGSAGIFRSWAKQLMPDIELIAIQLPGRDERFTETLYTDLTALMQAISTDTQHLIDTPCVLFGHSMGARLAYEYALKIQATQPGLLRGLIASAARAPQEPASDPIHHLDDSAFLSRVAEENGTPAEILANDELMSLLLPRIRADYTLTDTAPLDTREAPLDCPLYAFCGDQDPHIDGEKMQNWSDKSKQQFDLSIFSGDHFFINTEQAQTAVLQRINDILDQAVTQL